MNPLTVATCQGEATITTSAYDAGDRLTQIVDSVSGTTTRTYDSLNRLTSETTPQGSVGTRVGQAAFLAGCADEMLVLEWKYEGVLLSDERPSMKQMALSNVLTLLACALVLCVVAPGLVFAEQAQYIYDDLGRMSQVIDGQGTIPSTMTVSREEEMGRCSKD